MFANRVTITGEIDTSKHTLSIHAFLRNLKFKEKYSYYFCFRLPQIGEGNIFHRVKISLTDQLYHSVIILIKSSVNKVITI